MIIFFLFSSLLAFAIEPPMAPIALPNSRLSCFIIQVANYAKEGLKGFSGREKTEITDSPSEKVSKAGPLSLFWHALIKKGPLNAIIALHERYGISFTTRVPGLNVRFEENPEVISEILHKTDLLADSAFEKSNFVLETVIPYAGDQNLLLYGGEKWRTERKQLTPNFTPKAVSSDEVAQPMNQAIAKRIGKIRERIERSTNKESVVDFSQEMTGEAFDVLSATLFGRKSSDAEVNRLVSALNKVYKNLKWESFLTWLPNHEELNYKNLNPTLKEADRDIDTYVQRVLRDARQKSPEQRTPFMNSLLGMVDEHSKPVSDAELRSQMKLFLVAGHETSASLMSWAFYELQKNPQAKAALLAEIDGKLRGKVPSPQELSAKNMPYLDQVISETLRKDPPFFALTRRATKDFTMATKDGNVSIQKDTHIFMCPFLAHRNPATWGVQATGYGVDSFAPERFGPDAPGKGLNKQLVAFGQGPRVCIGQHLAVQEAKMVLVNFLQNFEISSAGDLSKLQPESDISYHLKSLPLVVKKRVF